ncbi:MAG: histidine kinase [Bacteroidales bacterium]|nr:histidine kinase [Bacteroidales bacterium]
MLNPIINNKRYLIVYLIFWAFLLSAHFFIVLLIFKMEALVALSDALVFSFIMAIIGLGQWYLVRFNPSQGNSVFQLVVTHLAGAGLSIIGWLAFGEVILAALYPEQNITLESAIGSYGWRIFQGVFIYSLISLVYYIIIYYENLQEKNISETRLKTLVKEAELSALKSQINPHFLFNSLNSISSLTISNPEKAQVMIIELSDFFRYSLKHNSKDFVKLEEELENIELYLDIEKIRFGEKIIIENQIDEDCLSWQIPAMSLQPIYENAIKYGISERSEPTPIITRIYHDSASLYINIKNQKSEFPVQKKGSGTGLRNIAERMELIYQERNLLEVADDKKFFEVRIRVPRKG